MDDINDGVMRDPVKATHRAMPTATGQLPNPRETTKWVPVDVEE